MCSPKKKSGNSSASMTADEKAVYGAYLERYKDVKDAALAEKHGKKDPLQYAKNHWFKFGQNEGRTLYATTAGGTTPNPVVAPTDATPDATSLAGQGIKPVENAVDPISRLGFDPAKPGSMAAPKPAAAPPPGTASADDIRFGSVTDAERVTRSKLSRRVGFSRKSSSKASVDGASSISPTIPKMTLGESLQRSLGFNS